MSRRKPHDALYYLEQARRDVEAAQALIEQMKAVLRRLSR